MNYVHSKPTNKQKGQQLLYYLRLTATFTDGTYYLITAGGGGLPLSLIIGCDFFPPLRFTDRGGSNIFSNIFNNISDVLKPKFYFQSVKLAFKEPLQTYLQTIRNKLFNYCQDMALKLPKPFRSFSFVSFLIMIVLVALHKNISMWNHLPLERESNKAR